MFERKIVLKNAFIAVLLSNLVLTNIAYANCTQEEKEEKIQLIIRDSSSKVPFSEFDVFIA